MLLRMLPYLNSHAIITKSATYNSLWLSDVGTGRDFRLSLSITNSQVFFDPPYYAVGRIEDTINVTL
jgi:hypothetical protein